MRYVLIS